MADDPTPLAADVVDAHPSGADGADRPTAVVLVHGFTQTGRCWGPVATDLARHHRLVLVDAPGHGRSATLDPAAGPAAAALGAAGGRGTYVGYSMGARLALRLAVDRPDLVERLVLIGGSPGLADPTERADRRRSDDALADRIERLGVPTFLDEWLALPLFAGLPPEQRCLAERRTNTAAGLAASLRRFGTGVQEPLWDRLGELTVPVLLVTGADDGKFTALGARMAEAIGPSARHVVVPDAGHTTHLERPDTFLAELRPWLRATAG